MQTFNIKGYTTVQERTNPQPAKCTKCDCSWFEQVEVKQFKADHNVIIGQTVPVASPYSFYLLRCIKCAELFFEFKSISLPRLDGG